MLNYKRFDRHQLFTAEDLTNVRNAINDIMDQGKSFGSLHNSICGLYDGYLYDGIDVEAYQELSFDVFIQLSKTLKKIEDSIKVGGESVTLV